MSALDGNERERLEAAERALVMFGWCGVGDSERDQAATELWQRWAALVDSDFLGPRAHPDLDARALAACRRARRDQTLAEFVERG